MRPCNPTALGIARCPNLTERTRCAEHEHQYQRSRGSTAARGYGGAHQQGRAALAATLPAPCGYCGVVIGPGEPWDAAHVVDGQPEYGWMVSHSVCNQRARGAA